MLKKLKQILSYSVIDFKVDPLNPNPKFYKIAGRLIRYFLTIVIIISIFASLIFEYKAMAKSYNYFFYSFIYHYLMIIFPISVLGIIIIFTKGKFRTIRQYLKPIIVMSAILIVVAFTMMRWTKIVSTYGEYGNNTNFKGNNCSRSLYFPFVGYQVSEFEMETIYREAIEYKYHLTLIKIFIFDGIVFFSTFLLLQAIPNKNIKIKNKKSI